MKYLNTFIKAKNLDKQMVMDYLQGQDPRKVYPLYHAPLIPTFAGASQDRDEVVAEWLAFSNAVRQITF